LIDDRAYDTTDETCNCIPAADNPPVSSAKDAKWLKDDDIVFGVEVNGEYRAYPRRIMDCAALLRLISLMNCQREWSGQYYVLRAC